MVDTSLIVIPNMETLHSTISVHRTLGELHATTSLKRDSEVLNTNPENPSTGL